MNPRLIIEGVEVININKESKVFDLVVHLKVTPSQIHTFEVQELICKKVEIAIKYLIAEGFLPDVTKDREWKCSINGRCSYD